jgi:hypothetical protein
MTSSLPPLGRVRTLLEAGLAEQVELKEARGICPGCSFGNLAVERSSVDDVLRRRLERLFDDWAGLIPLALRLVGADPDTPTQPERATERTHR